MRVGTRACLGNVCGCVEAEVMALIRDRSSFGIRELKSFVMTTSKANPKVDAFIANAKNWQAEFKKLVPFFSTPT